MFEIKNSFALRKMCATLLS